MRRPRVLRRGQDTGYHCMSRAVGGQHLFNRPERDAFCSRLRKLAAFCQVRVYTYTCLSNHFHVLAGVPAKVRLSDPKLAKLIRAYYGPKHAKSKEFTQALKHPNSPTLALLRQRYLVRMGDLSVFMKELKEGFSKWFNDRHERFGTLWAERFKSLLVADGSQTLLFIAAYIDLNSVRAGLSGDPKDYVHCGYAEALARAGPAREGLASVLPGKTWEDQVAEYRKLLFGYGAAPRRGKRALDPDKALEVLGKGGRLSRVEVLLVKVRYFSEGIAVGSEEFIEEIFDKCHRRHCREREEAGWPMEGADWDGLMSLKQIKEPFDLPAQQT